jgi:hypothetical protein
MPPLMSKIRHRARARRVAAAEWAVIALDAAWLAEHRQGRRKTDATRGRSPKRR